MFNNYHLPSLKNKTIIITGSNSGIGLHAATKLASQGAHIIIAARSEERSNNAIKEIKSRDKNASCEFIQLDLKSFNSIKNFATEVKAKHSKIDILINNAGVILQDPNNISVEGFDPHIATNCLGHFLLTNLLLPLLKASEKSRIVTVASSIEKLGVFDIESFAEKGIPGWLAYTYSKIGALIISKELNRKLKKAKLSNIISVASHPGITITDSPQVKGIGKVIVNGIGMPVEKGALSLLVAATSDELKGGEYIGNTGFLNINGKPCINKPSKKVDDADLAKKLWQKCEKLTDTKFNK